MSCKKSHTHAPHNYISLCHPGCHPRPTQTHPSYKQLPTSRTALLPRSTTHHPPAHRVLYGQTRVTVPHTQPPHHDYPTSPPLTDCLMRITPHMIPHKHGSASPTVTPLSKYRTRPNSVPMWRHANQSGSCLRPHLASQRSASGLIYRLSEEIPQLLFPHQPQGSFKSTVCLEKTELTPISD